MPFSTDRRLNILLRELQPYWPRLAVGLVLSVLAVLLGLIQPLLMKTIVDVAIPDKRTGLLLLLLAGLVVLPVMMTLLGASQTYFMNSIGQRVARDLRVRLYGRMLRLPMAIVADTKPGDMVYSITSDCGEIEAYLSNDLLPSAAAAVQLIGLSAVMLYLDWRLALLGLAIFPLAMMVVRMLGRQQRQISHLRSEHRAAGAAALHETLGNIKTIQVFQTEAYETQRFGEWNRRDLALWLRHAVLNTFAEQISYRLLSSVGVGIVFGFGGWRVIQGGLSLGSVVAFVAYLPQAYVALNSLLSTHLVTVRIDAPLRRVAGYMDAQRPTTDDHVSTAACPLPPAHCRLLPGPWPLAGGGRLRFERVSFAYQSGRGRLDEITFEVAPGETVAIVGLSGAGKSTIFDLIMRLYEPRQGRILLDGRDLSAIPVADVRRHVGLVAQDVIIWNASVRDNIRYGSPWASDEEVARVASLAQIHAFIQTLPEKYDTIVGDRGVKLSGGERQRIAIARVLLRRPRVLLLDEITSALDALVEESLMAALRPVLHGRTVLIVAHRLATLRSANRILVVDEGRLVEEGTHQALLEKGGLYGRLYETQFSRTPQGT